MLRQLQTAMGAMDSGAGGKSVDVKAWKEPLGPLFKMWDTAMKTQLAKLRAVEVRAVTADDPPVVAFVLADILESHNLMELVTLTLNNIQKVIAGTIMSTPDIQNQAQCLLRSEAPPAWGASWPSAPEDPTQYLQGIAKRIVALKGDWVKRVSSGSVVQGQVRLSDFLRPDVFLNALRQQSARRLQVSIDSLHLVASFEPQLLSDASTSPLPVTVEGLILEGCSFDEQRKILVEGDRNSPLVSVLPPLTIAWMAKAAHPERALSTANHRYSVSTPIYASLTRERLVAEVALHTEQVRARVFNSSALFLSDSQ